MSDALIETVTTVRLVRGRTLHRYKLEIIGKRVVMFTKCGIDCTEISMEITHGIPTCDKCEAAK